MSRDAYWSGARYSTESLERALEHHKADGRILDYQRNDDNPRQRWHVWGVGGLRPNLGFFSDRQCAALCFGLASADYAERKAKEAAEADS